MVRAHTWLFVLPTKVASRAPSLMQKAARFDRLTFWPLGETAWLNVPPT